MASEIRTFGTQANDNASGATPWSNATNAASSNDSRATVSLTGSSNSQYLKLTNSSHASGDTLTSSDTPTSVKYRFERRKGGNPSANIRDWKIHPVKGGVIQTGVNLADTGTDWTTSDTTIEYTQSTSLPTAAEILDSGWGVVLAVQNTNGVGSGQAEVDYGESTVNFTPTLTVGQVTETDTAQAIGKQKRIAVGQVSETDAAQNITNGQRIDLVQVTETDTAQAIGKQKRIAVGQVSETGAAQTITPSKRPAFAQATETDTAQAIGHKKYIAVGQAMETDSALGLHIPTVQHLGGLRDTHQIPKRKMVGAIRARPPVGVLFRYRRGG